MTVTITIDPGGASETVLGPGLVDDYDSVRIHTGVSDWRATVAYDTSLADLKGSAVHIEDSATDYFFRGFLIRTGDREAQGEAATQLQGLGIEHDLQRNENEKQITNQYVHDAIDDYWTNDTTFTATVTDQTADETTSGTQAQEANTDAEFNAIVTIADNIPLAVQNTNLELLQTCFTEGQAVTNLIDEGGAVINLNDNDATYGESVQLASGGDFVEYSFTSGYTIPAEDFDFAARYELDGNEGPRIEVSVDGDLVAVQQAGQTAGLAWRNTKDGGWDGEARTPSSDLNAGTHTVRFEAVQTRYTVTDENFTSDHDTFVALDKSDIIGDSETVTDDGGGTTYSSGDDYEMNYSSGEIKVLSTGSMADSTTFDIDYTYAPQDFFKLDTIAPNDTGGSRFTPNYTFDNTLDGNQGHLDGPELYPEQVELEFDQAPTTWSVNTATLSTTWDDTTGEQRIQLQLPPNGTWGPSDGTEDNTDTITDFGFGSDQGTAIKVRARFSRYGSTTGQTPKTGFNGQQLQDLTLTFDGDDIPVITDTTFEGSDMEILQQLHAAGRMRFTVEHADGSKNVESYPLGGIVKAKPDWRVISTERVHDLGGSYSNHITVRGAKDDDGNRLKRTVSDATEIANFGQEHWEEKRPGATTQTEVDRIARQVLKRHLQESDVTAEREIFSLDVAPGYSYPIRQPDGTETNVPSEEVHYRVSAGDVKGRILFNVRATQLQERINAVDAGLRDTKLAF